MVNLTPMPRLLLPAASATGHLSLSHFHCYCYSCPRLCHISALLLLRTLHWSPCCASGLPRARYPHCRAPHRRNFLELDTYLPTCLMYSTGCPSSSGSCSVLVPWSGGVSWVLLRPTSEIFAIPPRAPEDAFHSDHPNRGYSLFLLLVHPQPRPVHSRWLVPLCGMGFRCR